MKTGWTSNRFEGILMSQVLKNLKWACPTLVRTTILETLTGLLGHKPETFEKKPKNQSAPVEIPREEVKRDKLS
jgi:hypothetical protein